MPPVTLGNRSQQVDQSQEDWPPPVAKGAHAIWWWLHSTGREPHQLDELGVDTFDDLCIQARDTIAAAALDIREDRQQ